MYNIWSVTVKYLFTSSKVYFLAEVKFILPDTASGFISKMDTFTYLYSLTYVSSRHLKNKALDLGIKIILDEKHFPIRVVL